MRLEARVSYLDEERLVFSVIQASGKIEILVRNSIGDLLPASAEEWQAFESVAKDAAAKRAAAKRIDDDRRKYGIEVSLRDPWDGKYKSVTIYKIDRKGRALTLGDGTTLAANFRHRMREGKYQELLDVIWKETGVSLDSDEWKGWDIVADRMKRARLAERAAKKLKADR